MFLGKIRMMYVFWLKKIEPRLWVDFVNYLKIIDAKVDRIVCISVKA